MEKVYEIYNRANRYEPIKAAAKEATGAYQDAARGLDTLQERVLIEFGMPKTARVIHDLAHKMPVRFDTIGGILHQRHLSQEYPSTAEYTNQPEDLDEVFAEVVGMLDAIENCLRKCVEASDDAGLWPFGRQFENLQIENSKDYEKIMYAWQMYDTTDSSKTSFENWVQHLFDEEGK